MTGAKEGGAVAAVRGRVSRWRVRGLFLLFSGLFVAAALLISNLRYLEFVTSNWDLGIFQQGLWTTAHGRFFWEAGDWELAGTNSYFQVHPALVLLFVVPIYALVPSVETLFVLQAVAAALGAIPIFLLARRLLGRAGYGLAFAGLYLANGALLAATSFDVHIEAILPFEVGMLFYLWMVGRYRLGCVAAAATLITLEVTPFIVAMVALYFLLPPFFPFVRRSVQRLRRRLGSPTAPGPDRRDVPPVDPQRRRREVRWSAALLVAALASYPLLRMVQWYGTAALGVAPVSPLPVSSTVSAGPYGIPVEIQVGVHLLSKSRFWFILLALLGFLPLFAPRALLLTAPWFVFTLQSTALSFVLFGTHYALIPLSTLSLAAVLGYVNLERRILPWLARYRARRAARRAAVPGPRPHRFPTMTVEHAPGSRRLRRPFWIAALAIVVVANIAFGPLDPYQQSNPPGPLPGYDVSYVVPSGFHDVAVVAQQIPATATVLASADLFPLVADNPNAYAIPWTTTVYYQLPYSSGNLPQWVFIDVDQIAPTPNWLPDLLLNPPLYGVRDVVWSTPTGTVVLYERNFTGATTDYGLPPVGPFDLSGASLEWLHHGRVAPLNGSPTGSALVGTNSSWDPFFATSPVNLAPGFWNVTVWIAEVPMTPKPPTVPGPSASGLALNLTAFGYNALLGVFYCDPDSPVGHWTPLTIAIRVLAPTVDVQISGPLTGSGTTYAVALVEFRHSA